MIAAFRRLRRIAPIIGIQDNNSICTDYADYGFYADFRRIGYLYGKIPLCVGGASPRSAADAVLGGAGEAGIEQSGQDRDRGVFVARAPIGLRREWRIGAGTGGIGALEGHR